jgi:hypothetical protein
MEDLPLKTLIEYAEEEMRKARLAHENGDPAAMLDVQKYADLLHGLRSIQKRQNIGPEALIVP